MHVSDPTPGTHLTFDQDATLSTRPTGICCPVCRDGLVMGEIDGSQFAGCPSCRGMLFQQPVFAALIQHLRANFVAGEQTPRPMNPEELKIRRVCPTCDRQMETHPYGGPGNAVIDTCIACNLVWFDQGELTNLVRAPGRR